MIAPPLDDTLEQLAAAPDFMRRTALRFSRFLQGPVLEIGAGTGSLTRELMALGHDVVATEYDGRRLDALRSRLSTESGVGGRGRFVTENLDLNRITAEDKERCARPFGTLGSIVASNVIEHIEDDVACLKTLKTWLKPGGTFCMVVPAYPWLFSPFDEVLGHYRRYTRGSARALFEDAGFVVRDVHCFNAVGILGWALNFRVLRRTRMPQGQLKLFHWLTPLIELEDRFRLPFGLSIVVVGEAPSPQR
jgi:SAM-dependent methyltransferase